MSDYSSTAEVLALTRMYLAGETTYNTTTIPTSSEVNTFLDRSSGVLNLALVTQGFSTPITDATAKLACDEWVTQRAVMFVELSQPTTEYAMNGNARAGMLAGLMADAALFVEANMMGFQNLGVPQAKPTGRGVQYTGQEVYADRPDPKDTSLEQPFFRRRQFDAP